MTTDLTGPPLAAVVVAAGESRRFGADKLFQPLGGRPVLDWCLAALEGSARVERVVLVLGAGNLARARALVARRGYRKIRAVCVGGPRRQDSVLIGLESAGGCAWVAIHDGARPFLTEDVLDRVYAAALASGAAIAAVPVKDTVKLVGPENRIERTPARDRLWAAQTPQIFRYDALLAAYGQGEVATVTDDAELIERAGQPVAVAMGSYANLKITTPEDLVLARALARSARAGRHPLSPLATREPSGPAKERS